MKLLLDTHVWLWLELDPDRIPASFTAAIADPESQVHVSVASVWELGIKHRLGKIAIPEPFDTFQRDALHGLTVVDIRLSHVERGYDLPPIHRDPKGRILIAQALAEGLTLLSVDHVFPAYGVPMLPP